MATESESNTVEAQKKVSRVARICSHICSKENRIVQKVVDIPQQKQLEEKFCSWIRIPNFMAKFSHVGTRILREDVYELTSDPIQRL